MSIANTFLLEGPRGAVESWWEPIQSRGLAVETNPPLNVSVPPEADGVRYRGGVVRDSGASVWIMPTAGPPAPSTSPLRGKYLLLLQFKGKRRPSENPNYDLAIRLMNILKELGCKEVPPPREFFKRQSEHAGKE